MTVEGDSGKEEENDLRQTEGGIIVFTEKFWADQTQRLKQEGTLARRVRVLEGGISIIPKLHRKNDK